MTGPAAKAVRMQKPDTGMRSAAKLFSRASERALWGVVGLLAILAFWQALTIGGLAGSLTFPSPAQTWAAFVDLVASGEILPDLVASAQLFGAALAIGIVVGVPLGMLSGSSSTIRGLLTPHIAVIYSLPSIALLPLFIVVLGFGFASQFAIVLLFTFFPPYFAGLEGVTTADRGLIRVARSFGAGELYIFRAIVLPGSVPAILYGIRVAVVMAIRGVVLAELIASTTGVGFLLRTYGDHFRTANIFALIIVISMVGVAVDTILRVLQGKFDSWRPEH